MWKARDTISHRKAKANSKQTAGYATELHSIIQSAQDIIHTMNEGVCIPKHKEKAEQSKLPTIIHDGLKT